MTYPIAYDMPAKTFSRFLFGGVMTVLGGIGLAYNLLNNPLENPGGSVLALVSLVFGAGVIWGMMNPQKIRLTESELQLPRTIVSGHARNIPYEDIIGISLVPSRKVGHTAIIMSVNHKMSVSTYLLGYRKFFDLIEQIHAHAPHLGAPPIGTIGGLFRAGRKVLPS